MLHLKKYVCTGPIWKILYLAVFLVPLLYNPWGGANPYELTKHAFLAGMVGVMAAVLFLMVLDAGKIQVPFHSGAAVVIGLLVFSFFLSTIFSIAPLESFWGTYDRLQGLTSVFFYGAIFLCGLFVLRDELMRRRFFAVTMGVGAIVALYAVLQKFGVDFLRSEEPLFAGRSFATLGSPTGLGQFLIFPISVAIFFTKAGDSKKSPFSISRYLLLFLFLLALFFTQNRASILGIFAAFALFVFFRAKGWARKIIITIVAALLAVIVIVAVNPDFRSLGTRATLWRASLPLVLENPVLGSGPETYYQTAQTVIPPDLYLFERMTDIPDRSHNILLDALLMRGGLGLALWLVNLGFLVYVLAARRAKTAAAAIALFAIIAHTVSMQFGFVNTTDAVFLMAMWAILLLETLKWRDYAFNFSAVILRLSKGKWGSRLVTPPKILFLIFFLVVAYFGVSHSYRLMRADTLFQSAMGEFLRSDDPRPALGKFNEVLAAAPQYGYLYRSIFILFRDDFLQRPELLPFVREYAARLDLITGGSFHAQMAHAVTVLAEAEVARADLFFAAAAQRAPNWPVVWMEWGEILFARGDFEGATEKFERVLALAPPYWKWEEDLDSHTPEEREKYRIFRISNQRFYEALAMLTESNERRLP